MRFAKCLILILMVSCCATSTSCAKGMEVSAEDLVNKPSQYEGQAVSTVGCVLAGRHGATFFPCGSRARGLRVQIQPKFEETKEGKEFMSAMYSAWAPNAPKFIPVEISGSVKSCRQECVFSIERVVVGKPRGDS